MRFCRAEVLLAVPVRFGHRHLPVMLTMCALLLIRNADVFGEDSLGVGIATRGDSVSLKQARELGREQSRYRSRAATAVSEQTTADLATYQKSVQQILKTACADCHGEDEQQAEFRVDELNPDLLNGGDSDWWVEVLAVLTNGEMPPSDGSELSDEDRVLVIDWLSREIQVASSARRASRPHSSFRRLTAYEFNYALQDLLGVNWQFARDLPPETASEDGFRNSSELLQLSVSQLQTYRQLARRALMRATVTGDQPAALYWHATMQEAGKHYWSEQQSELDRVRKELKHDAAAQQQKLSNLEARFKKRPSNSYYVNAKTQYNAEARWRYSKAKYAIAPDSMLRSPPEVSDNVAVIPRSGQVLTVELGNQVPDQGLLKVRVRASRLSMDESVPSLQLLFGWQATNEGRALVPVGKSDQLITAEPGKPDFYEWRIPLGDIYPRNSFRRTSSMGGFPSPSEYIRFRNSSANHAGIVIDYVEVTAPVYESWPPDSHRRIFGTVSPSDDETNTARSILQNFMTKAWRRQIAASELDSKVKLFGRFREAGDSFEQSVIETLSTVLASPGFLFLVQQDRGQVSQLSDTELASRLSFFLWSSIPDRELLELAGSDRLNDDDQLLRQVDRMLHDNRSKRFARHFTRQWLNLELLDFLKLNRKDRRFDPLLKEAMAEEPLRFFQEIMQQNASVLDFLHADYAMVNERLARHYGVGDVRGNHFRRVTLPDAAVSDGRRGGLLTQAGLLAMNSDGQDSHPLKRGIWMLERILNDPPPPPPPAVPEIDLADPRIAEMTLKERIEDHRNHAACRSCHAKIDPWGIAFENYDATGRWRDSIGGDPVDATSALFNEQPLEGISGLKRYLLMERQDQFVRAFVHKIATYALGRPTTFEDRAALDAISAEVRQQGDGLTTVIRCLVTSELFRSR